MTEHVYRGKLFEQATSTDHLNTRLELNKKYSSTDFDEWLMARLDPSSGQDILDVGCGTGAQSLPFLNAVGDRGSVSSLDISADSIETLKKRVGSATNFQAIAADMASLDECIRKTFRTQKFDLAHSSYALYYSPQRLKVLDVMCEALKPGGKLAVFTPTRPHGMVDFARRFHPIPPEVDESLQFGASVLEPYFRRRFWNVTIHFFRNRVRVTDSNDFMNFYRATTYYVRDAEQEIREQVTEIVRAEGCIEFEKNGYLILGQSRFDPRATR